MQVPLSRRSKLSAGFTFGALLFATSLWVGCQNADKGAGPAAQNNPVKNSAQTRCSDVLEPVCGANGVSYRNSCAASEVGETKVVAQGICPGKPLDGWTSVEDPGTPGDTPADPIKDTIRCGTPDPTDPDPISADPGPGLGGFDPTCKAVFPPGIAIKCMSTIDPVCGCDGKTYRNSCVANGAGHVYAKAKGACPGQPFVDE